MHQARTRRQYQKFSDDSDEFLKNAPDVLGKGKLDDTVGRLDKKLSDGLISGEVLDRAQAVVLKTVINMLAIWAAKSLDWGFPSTSKPLLLKRNEAEFSIVLFLQRKRGGYPDAGLVHADSSVVDYCFAKESQYG